MNTWVIGQKQGGQVQEYLLTQAKLLPSRVFCFDYFDTLVVRKVEPEHTKKMASSLLSQTLGSLLSADELYEYRYDLEKTLCEERAAGGGELEFYLPDLAKAMRKLLLDQVDFHPILQTENRFVQAILDLETVVELNVQQPCVETISVLQQLKKEQQKTILISDFYLPGSHFHKMLHKFDLFHLFDHIYISADYGLAKGSGRLYEKVCADLQCMPEQLIMIGDNQHSDVNRAIEKGIEAIHIQNPAQETIYQNWINREIPANDVAVQLEKLANMNGPFCKIQFTLWAFTVRLFQRLMKQKTKDVFFFSKEGEFLKKLFDKFQNDVFGDILIKSHYILVSRKATFLASLKTLSEETFERIFLYYRDISLRDFLLSLNFEESVARSLCEQIGLNFHRRYSDFPKSEVFKRLLAAEQFKKLFEERRVTQCVNCIAYLDSYGVDYEVDGLTIVDVGWKGSIQDNLFHILKGRVSVQGYFIGSLFATEKRDNNKKEGVLFDDFPQPTKYFNVYNNNRSLFEMVLGASHGSADGYFSKEQFNNLPDDHQRVIQQRVVTPGGELLIATLDLPEERKLFQKQIKPLQDQILAVIPKFNRVYVEYSCSLPDSEWFARQHASMVYTPKKSDVDFFESLYHLENFGVFEFTDFRANTKLSIGQRCKNFKELRRDPSVLEMGTWPPIILRRLGLDFYRYINGYRRLQREFK